MSKKLRVAILISGRGSNMQALHQASLADDYPADIIGVLSDKADAAGLKYAEDAGLNTAIVERGAFASKADHEAAIQGALEEWDAELLALAGFMRVLSADFVRAWPQKIINIHPSLLPKYKGLDTHARALEAGDKKHGCSVHYVTADLDAGPVIMQAEIDVLANDTIQTLEQRLLPEEHKLYPLALSQIANLKLL